MTTKYQKQQKGIKKNIRNLKIRLICLDKKSIVRIVLIFCGMASLGVLMTVDIKGNLIRQSPNWATTMGQVQSIEVITGIEQTKTGNQIATRGHKIKYYYVVDGVVYEQEVFIGRGQRNSDRFISFIKPLDSIEIYFKKKRPQKSYINFDINRVTRNER